MPNTDYIILGSNDGVIWELVRQVSADSQTAAIRTLENPGGELLDRLDFGLYSAVPERSWSPVAITIERVIKLTPANLPPRILTEVKGGDS
jgi:hypothetical protein